MATSLFRQILPRPISRSLLRWRAHFHTVYCVYAENRFLAPLSKHTIGSGSCNRLISPLFGQITGWLPRYLGRFNPLYKQIFVTMASAFSHSLMRLCRNRFLAWLSKHTIGSGSRNRFLSPLFGQITVWLPRYLGRFYPTL